LRVVREDTTQGVGLISVCLVSLSISYSLCFVFFIPGIITGLRNALWLYSLPGKETLLGKRQLILFVFVLGIYCGLFFSKWFVRAQTKAEKCSQRLRFFLVVCLCLAFVIVLLLIMFCQHKRTLALNGVIL